MKYLLLKFFFILLIALNVSPLIAQLPRVVAGSLQRHENFTSSFVSPRHVDVWLPEGYNSHKKYKVLYMHDGQMLFDSAVTWNKQAWDADDVITSLLREKKIRDVIVVGIWNGGSTRHSDYFPQKPFESLTKEEKERIYASGRSNGAAVFSEYKISSDNYLKFIVKELMPFIEKNYAVRKGPEHTFIAGSSMGGLISLYAICEYPQVFGGAACLSTHWPGIFTMENNPVPDTFIEYMRSYLPAPGKHKLYFDHGTTTLDSLYPPLQKKADEVLRSKGFTSRNWVTREFPGEDHSEKAWGKRLYLPLVFLLGRK